MHLPDGLLPPSFIIPGYAVASGSLWYSLRQIHRGPEPTTQIPKASLLAAAFFVLSLLHIPVPPTSIHLVMNGLMGIVLGYYALPAIAIALFFQAVFFAHGGLSTLGLNFVIMGLPALLAYQAFQRLQPVAKRWGLATATLGAGIGAGAVLLSAGIFVAIAILGLPADLDAAMERRVLLITLVIYSVQAVVEGIFTGLVLSFLARVKPELLRSSGFSGIGGTQARSPSALEE